MILKRPNAASYGSHLRPGRTKIFEGTEKYLKHWAATDAWTASRYYHKNKYSRPGPCGNGLTSFARTEICKILVVRLCRPVSLDQSGLWLGEAPRAGHGASRMICE